MLREEILKRLKNIDEEIFYSFGTKYEFRFVIVGGSALILNFESSRGTPDIDVLDLNSKVIDIAEKYDMNCRVNAYIFNFPYNYEDRLVYINDKDFKVCKFATPSLEDLIVSKLAASRPKDVEDLNSPQILKQIDWNKLIKIVEKDKEFEMSNNSDRARSDFIYAYNKYKKEHFSK